jgi:hypothetical protein
MMWPVPGMDENEPNDGTIMALFFITVSLDVYRGSKQ